MEAQEEMIIKKKRSKRPRLVLTMASSSCSTAEAASSSSSAGLAQEQEEEEDMAKCLILLAQGSHAQKSSSTTTTTTPPKAATATVDHPAYQCKTCNRCFPSFQALGGHRASHKKPKPMLEDQHKRPGLALEKENFQLNDQDTTTLSLQIPSPSAHNKIRVHECSICGAEFNSGQALGGHMRRHRPIPMVPVSNQEESDDDHHHHREGANKKSRTLLSLDLNLPAAAEDDDLLESKFPFAAKEQVIVFAASPLVDCHY